MGRQTQLIETRTLHLVETVLLDTVGDLGGGETDAGIGLEELLRHDTSRTGLDLLLVIVVDGRILRLELLDEGVHVLFLLFVLGRYTLGRQGLFILVAHTVAVLMAKLLLLVLHRGLESHWMVASRRRTHELSAGHIGAEVVWRDCASVLCRGQFAQRRP